MMNFKQIHFGKVYTHLNQLLQDIDSTFQTGTRPSQKNIDKLTRKINADPIYKSIEKRIFRAPVQKFPLLNEINKRLANLEQLSSDLDYDQSLKDYLTNFVTNINYFINNSYKSGWDKKDSYFIIPVIAKADEPKEKAGMVYIKLGVPGSGSPEKRLQIDDLTDDPDLLSFTKDYFGNICAALLNSFYFVQMYPFGRYHGLTNHRYSLHFGSRISEGKSMGVAALAMFIIAHLNSVLGAEYHDVIAPTCGTVLTGEIDSQGNVKPVGDIEKKIIAIHKEFGPGIKLILPYGVSIPDSIKLDRGNLFYVSNIEQLLAELLFCQGRPGSLDEARTAVFRKLSSPQINELKKYVKSGIDPGIYENMIRGRGSSLTPKKSEEGIYSISKAWHDLVDVRFGLEDTAFRNEEVDVKPEKELILVIIDGSEQMDQHWAVGDNKINRITNVLYEIAQKFDPLKRELKCGFLSYHVFISIKSGAQPLKIEEQIQEIRETNGLRKRGSFFRPVYEALLREYATRSKLLYLITDSSIYDLEDLGYINVSAFKRWRLFSDVEYNSESEDIILFPDGKALNRKVLARDFFIEQGLIRKIQINFGDELPIDWQPQTGNMIKSGDDFIISWDNIDGLKYDVRAKFANQHPQSLKITGNVKRGQKLVEFAFTEYPMISAVKSIMTNQEGQLNKDELEKWQTICHPQKKCPYPECQETEVHLFHKPGGRIFERPIFSSLSHLEGDGYLLMMENSAEWIYFVTGYQLADGVSFVTMNGSLYWSQAKGHLERVPSRNNVYHLQFFEKKYYLKKME